MTKSELRKIHKKLRLDLSESQIDDYSLDIANNLLKLRIWSFEFYHTYLTIIEHREVNTDHILNILSGKDKNIVVSKSDFNTQIMTHVLLTDNTTLKKNSWNIPEPVNGINIPSEQIDVVFVPLLAFDVRGNRVGYGKGFYDRFLKDCRPETIKIGLSFFKASQTISDISENDIPLNYCVTPHEVYQF